MTTTNNIVTYLLKAFLGNGSINTVNVQQWNICLSERMLLRVARQQRTNEDAGKESRDLFYVCVLPYATIELCFLCVVRAEAI
jgi:hypothetical protein